VVVANDPSDAQATALTPGAADLEPVGGTVPEVLRTSTRLGYAAALNIGLRRVAGEFVLLADTSAWPTGDAIAPLAAALADTNVAAAGGFGLYSEDDGPLRPNALSREPAAAGEGTAVTRAADPATATAIEGAWLAFRRSDYIALGPLDERFVTPSWLDVWWSLRLRAGEEPEGAEYVETAAAGDDTAEGDGPTGDPGHAVPSDASHEIPMPPPRRAVRLDLPLERDEVPWPPDRARLNRRNMYRILDRFGWREDLA
jgi:hypothetical protein